MAAVFASQLLAGCAEMTHLTRTRNLGGSQFLLIDAKQRAISSFGNVNCAEPSPDALSAIAASQGLNVATPSGVSVGQSLAIAESAGSIGLRTQSIQLLRDHMFRVCEAYQANKLTPFMVALLHRRFQTTTIGILAIEQLTGTVRAPAIVLGGSADVGNADAVLKLSGSRETQAASVTAAQKELDSKTAAAKTADDDVVAKTAALAAAAAADKPAATTALTAATETQKTANADKMQADGTLATRKAALAAIDRALTLAQATGSASSGGAIGSSESRFPGDTQAVATAVSAIVKQTLDLGNTKDFCTVLLADAAQTNTTINVNGPVFQACVKLLATGNMLSADLTVP
ncbi:hypothetical protein [Sphingomonas aerolata]|uniref:hypothetical protein n=1 Tax=Sphingomonas aerolata TaxID=185951 RepID=UPI002FDF33E8